MKKVSIVALTAAAVVATTASPLAVWAGTKNTGADSLAKNGYAVIEGTVGRCDSIKDILTQVEPELGGDSWSSCKPGVIIQEITKPQHKPENKPGAGAETPETEIPETKPENNNGTTAPDHRPENVPGEDVAELSFAEQVVKLVNEERTKAGLAEVTLDKKIEAAALVRAKETEQSFSHTRPNKTSFSTALKEQGVSYRGAGENIAWGQKTPEDVMRAWMSSEGHRANILNAKFTKIGVGYYRNAQGRNYWTQLFTY